MQDLCFQAFDTQGRRRVQIARQALQLDPDCADAHVILAEKAGTLDDGLQHFLNGVQAAERTLGATFFAEKSAISGASRKVARICARCGLAQLLSEAGRKDEAIAHYQDLLRLNPNDNQGIRYSLLPELLTTGRDGDAARLLKEFDEESANWAYSCALLAFRLSGRSAAADRELRDAVGINPHVLTLLCSETLIPQPPFYEPGSFEEACVATEVLRPAYQATPGAIDWVADAVQQQQTESELPRRHQHATKRAKKPKKRKR